MSPHDAPHDGLNRTSGGRNDVEERELRVRERFADAAAAASAAVVALCEVFTRVGGLLQEQAKKEAADRRDLQGNVGGKK